MIEDLHGLPFARPAAHMRDYLSVLMPLLREGSVHHKGDFYQVDGGFVVPGTSPVPVLVGALSPLMVEVAGELADGVVTWLAGPRSLGEHIVPRLHAAAAGRPAPRVVAALPVAVCADTDLARRAADELLARYAGLEVYHRQLEREGVSSPGGVAVTGTEAGVENQLRQLSDLGVTEFWPIVFPVGDDPASSRLRTRTVLASLATAL